MPWDMHLSQTSEKGPHMDLTAFGPLGLGKGREWKERGTGWTFTLLLLSGSPQFHHPSPLLSYGSCIWRSSSPQFTGVSYHNFLMDGSTQGETDGRVERERQSREKLMHSRKKSIVSRRGGGGKAGSKGLNMCVTSDTEPKVDYPSSQAPGYSSKGGGRIGYFDFVCIFSFNRKPWIPFLLSCHNTQASSGTSKSHCDQMVKTTWPMSMGYNFERKTPFFLHHRS